MSDTELLGTQWAKAAQVLGVEFVRPFFLQLQGGRAFEFAGLLTQFGAKRGTLLMVHFDREAVTQAKAEGYTCSSMYPETRLPFCPDSYKECLLDWGWMPNDANPPDWYVQRGV
jgi:hypothetical protein